MKNKINLDKIIYILLVCILIGIPFCKSLSYVPFLNEIDDLFFKKARAYFLWVSIFFFLIVYLYSIISKMRKTNYVDYIFYVLIILGILSTIFAVDFNKSLYGEANRYEGLLTLISYYLILLNAKNLNNEKYKKNIIKIFIGIGVFQGIIGLMQTLTDFDFIRRFPKKYMAMGLCSNPNFYGSYMAMMLSISTIYFIYKRDINSLLLTILFSMNLYLAGSTGPLLGYFLAFILISVLLRKKYKRIIAIFMVFLLSCYISDNLLYHFQSNVNHQKIENRYNIKEDLKQTYDLATSKNESKINKIGSGRIKLWKNTLPLVKRYWLFGAGIDNFMNVYPQSGRLLYDKAHNVYLQIAVTNGIFALIAHLLICFLIFIKSIKTKNIFYMMMFMSFVAYCIQAFSNISVIDVAPYYYLIMGLLCSKYLK